MTILEALEKWLATIAPGQDAKHNLEALNKASVALGGPGGFKSVGPAWDDVLSRYQGGGGGDYTPYDGSYEVTPSTEDQVLETAGKGLDEDVRVGAVNATIDENIRPENIKKDIQILGVTGTLEGGEDVPAYDGSYTVTPTTAPQTLLTQGKKMTGNLEVEAVTSAIDDNIKADLILSMDPETNAPVSILGVAGGIPISESIDIVPSQDSAVQDRPEDPLPVVGGISDLKIHRKTFTERTATYLKADSPISYFSYVSDEEAAKIIPENIRKGVSILGVMGTYEGSAAPAPVIALSKAAVPGPKTG